ncbi:MAG: phosphocholine cytidylyltransferase family protein [Methylococcales bacterium]
MSVSTAIILAAGRGRRMEQLCQFKPKCLLELGGSTLLEWQLAALKTAHIHSTALVVGYQSKQLKGYTETVIENQRWLHSNIFISLACAADLLHREACVISYSDIVYHPAHVIALTQSNAPISITADLLWLDLWQRRFKTQVCDDAESFRYQASQLLEIGHRVTDPGLVQAQFMGLLKITPEGWAMIENIVNGLEKSLVENLDITALLQILIRQNIPVAVITV